MSENTIQVSPYEHVINKIKNGDVVEVPEDRNILFVRKVTLESEAKIVCPATSKMMMIGGK